MQCIHPEEALLQNECLRTLASPDKRVTTRIVPPVFAEPKTSETESPAQTPSSASGTLKFHALKRVCIQRYTLQLHILQYKYTFAIVGVTMSTYTIRNSTI